MFFSEFYVGFINSYVNPLNMFQTAQIYTGPNALYSPYVGSTILPDGPSPFAPDITGGLGLWVIVGICVGGFLLIVLIAILLICCCCKNNSDKESQDIVYAAQENNEEQLLKTNLDLNEAWIISSIIYILLK